MTKYEALSEIEKLGKIEIYSKAKLISGADRNYFEICKTFLEHKKMGFSNSEAVFQAAKPLKLTSHRVYEILRNYGICVKNP